jgi:hypothetical protein
MRVIRENGVIRVEEGDKTRVQVLKAFRNRFNVVLLRRGDAFFSVLFNHFVAATGRAPRANELFDVVFTHAVNAVGRVPRGDISFSANFIHATVGVGMGPRGDVEFSVTFTHDTAGAGRPPRELLAFVADYQHEIKGVGAVPKFVVAFAGLFTHESLGVGRMPRTVLHFDADFTHAVKGVGVAPSVPAGLLLDEFPGAAAAYSLRRLRAAYTGAAIRVRRSSDNAEQDIGFDGTELDTASLLAFVGAGSAFISKWYDQASNPVINTLQQNTVALQPLYDSGRGIVFTSDALAALNQLDVSTASTAFVVTDVTSGNKRILDQRGTGPLTSTDIPGFQLKYFNSVLDGPYAIVQDRNNYRVTVFEEAPAGLKILSAQFDLADLDNTQKVFINAVDKTSATVTDIGNPTNISTTQPFTVGANSNGQTTQLLNNDAIKEIIIYPTLRGDKNNIETNINAYYNVY